MQCLLKIALCQFTAPDRAPAWFAALTDQQVTRREKKFFPIIRIKVHYGHLGEVEAVPLDVFVTEVWAAVLPGLLVRVEHLAETTGRNFLKC